MVCVGGGQWPVVTIFCIGCGKYLLLSLLVDTSSLFCLYLLWPQGDWFIYNNNNFNEPHIDNNSNHSFYPLPFLLISVLLLQPIRTFSLCFSPFTLFFYSNLIFCLIECLCVVSFVATLVIACLELDPYTYINIIVV